MKFKSIHLAAAAVVCFISVLFSLSAFAADNATAKVEKLRAALEKRHPGKEVPSSIAPTQINGLYEVLDGDQIFYVDGTGTYFIFGGQLVDLAKQVNITEERKNRLLKVDVAALDPKDAIVTRRGHPGASRTLIVFSDPLCPFCHRLELELAKMDEIEIRTYLIPRPDAKAIAESIMCASDRSQAWLDYMNKKVAPQAATCSNPLDQTQAFATKYGIRGTPTLLTLDGRRTSGYRPLEGIDSFLANK